MSNSILLFSGWKQVGKDTLFTTLTDGGALVLETDEPCEQPPIWWIYGKQDSKRASSAVECMRARSDQTFWSRMAFADALKDVVHRAILPVDPQTHPMKWLELAYQQASYLFLAPLLCLFGYLFECILIYSTCWWVYSIAYRCLFLWILFHFRQSIFYWFDYDGSRTELFLQLREHVTKYAKLRQLNFFSSLSPTEIGNLVKDHLYFLIDSNQVDCMVYEQVGATESTKTKYQSLRDYYIHIATRVRSYDPGHWVKVVRDKIKTEFSESTSSTVVITDVRFPNEISLMQEEFGMPSVHSIRLFRGNHKEPDANISTEHALDDHVPDLFLVNNKSSFSLAKKRFPYLEEFTCQAKILSVQETSE